jgi:hypothetical protein
MEIKSPAVQSITRTFSVLFSASFFSHEAFPENQPQYASRHLAENDVNQLTIGFILSTMPQALVIRPLRAQVHWMISNLRARLLEVDVTALEPTRWKWTISDKSLEVVHGYAASRETAQIDGDDALFKLLSFCHSAP